MDATNVEPLRSASLRDAHRTFVNSRPCLGLRLRTCGIAGVGAYLPDQVMTNAEVGQRLGDDGEWIFALTGIRERRIAAVNEFTSDLAAQAARRALESAGLCAQDVELILAATNTPDMMFPATACLVQSKIGADKCPAFDLKAGGAGFLFALEIGRQFVASHAFGTVLVIGAEKLSSVLDWRDRTTCALFGDGAGAVVLRPGADAAGVLDGTLGSNGNAGELMVLAAGGSRIPASRCSVMHGLHFLRMQSRQIFKQAVPALCAATESVLLQNGLTLAAIDCIIPHQSNKRIIDAFARRIKARPGQVFGNLESCGNTSAASIPIALAAAVRAGRVKPGDLVLLVGFGSGLTWGAAIVRWQPDAARTESSRF